MKKPLRHIAHYLILCAFLSLSLVLLIYFNGLPKYQIPIIIITSLIYVFWGYLHHRSEGDLHQKILMEYVLYSILGAILIIGLI